MSDTLERIRKVIKSQDVIQSEFAKEIGFSAKHISNVLNNKAPVSEKVLQAICTKYNINMEWLKNGIGNMYITNKSIDTSCLIHLIDKLSEHSRKLAILMMEDLAKDNFDCNDKND